MTSFRRVLSIDGGGIKGVVPASFLASIEEATGRRTVDNFDLIVGTSTGGIIALGLGLGMTAAEILSFYRNDGPKIFGQEHPSKRNRSVRLWAACHASLSEGRRRTKRMFAPKHSSKALYDALYNVWGERILGGCLTRVVVPAYESDRRGIYVFKTSHDQRLQFDHRVRVVDIALATAAAPTYFPAHELPTGSRLIDGGTWANNPTGIAAVEAVGVLKWNPETVRILSLGCGDEFFIPETDRGLLGLREGVVDLLMQGQSSGALGIASVLVSLDNILRISPEMSRGTFLLDDTSKIDQLIGMGASCAREALPEVMERFFSTPREEFVPFHGLRSAKCAA